MDEMKNLTKWNHKRENQTNPGVKEYNEIQ